MRFRYRLLSLAATVVAGCLIGGAASAQVLYLEDFEDEMLAENTAINNAVIANSVLTLNDTEANTRATFSVVQDFTDPVMTFSFDIVEPIVQGPGGTIEMQFRAGIGTSANTLSSGEQIIEAIIFRNGNRGDYLNNGNETIFMVANNQDAPLTFASPIDGTDVMLTAFQYIPYVLDNETGVFGEVKGISNFASAHASVFGTFNRFGIGSSTNGNVGTAVIDDVLVLSGASFDRSAAAAGVPGDVDGDMDVDMDDYFIIRDNFQNPATERAEGDLNRSGVVDLVDFRQWKNNFPTAAPAPVGLGAAVPEPSAALLMVCGAIGLWSGRRRNRAAA